MKSNTYCVGIMVVSIVVIDISLCDVSSDINSTEQTSEVQTTVSSIFDACDASFGEPTEVCGDMASHLSAGPSWSTQWYEQLSLLTQQWAVSLLCRYCAVRHWVVQKIWQEKRSEC